MTVDQVMDLFDRQMQIVDLKLNTSFKKWAEARDETIKIFSSKTGIPVDKFEDRLLQRQVKSLFNR